MEFELLREAATFQRKMAVIDMEFSSGYSVSESFLLSGLAQVKEGLNEFVFVVLQKGLCKETERMSERNRLYKISKVLERLHRHKSPTLENALGFCFMKDHWSRIKYFLPTKGYRNVRSFEDLDAFGILSLITNCKLFDRHVTVDLNKRNNVFSKLCTLKTELEAALKGGFTHKQTLQYLQIILEALEAVKTEEFNKAVKEAIEQVKKLQKRFLGIYDVKHRPPEINVKEIAAKDKTNCNRPVLVVGPSGSGKTRLSNTILSLADGRRHSSSSGQSELSLEGKRRPVFLPDTWTRECYEAKKTSGLVQMGLLVLISSPREKSVKVIHGEKKPSQSEWTKVVHPSCETEVDDTQKGSARTPEVHIQILKNTVLVDNYSGETLLIKQRHYDEKQSDENEEFMVRKNGHNVSKLTSEEGSRYGNSSEESEELVEICYHGSLTKVASGERPRDGDLSEERQEDQNLAGVNWKEMHTLTCKEIKQNEPSFREIYISLQGLLRRYICLSEFMTYQSHLVYCMGPYDSYFTDKCSLFSAFAKARKTDVNIKRHVIDDRWIRFEGEPQIKIQQSLKKRRGVVFGTASRQGYKGSEDKPDGKHLESPGMTIVDETNKRPLGNLFSSPFDLFRLFPKLSMSPGSSKLTLKHFVLVSLFCCPPVTGNNHEFRKWDVDVELFFRGNSNIQGFVMKLAVLCLCCLLSGMQWTVHYKNSVVGKNPQAITSLLEVENEVYRKVHFETHDPVCLGTDEDAVTDEHTSEEFLSLKTKPQDITIDVIENLRSDQQRQQLIEEVYSSKYNKNEHVDDLLLTVAENEVEIHQCCQRKRFTLSQTEEILFDYMSEDLIQEEAEEKDDDIDSDPLDFTETQYIGGAQIVENELVSDEKTQKIDIPKENTTSQDRGASCFGDQPIDCNGEVTDIQRKSDCNTIKKDRKPSIEVKQQETTLISHKGSKLSYKNKHKVTMEVVPTPTFVTEKQAFSHRNNTKTWNSFRSFQNLKYKVEGENTRKRKIDCTLTEHEFDVFLLRKFTWLSLDQLPAPTLDPSVVGFVQEFEPLMVIIDLIASGTPPSPHVSMRYELLRFCTLRSYPKENKPYLIKLAEAGFYYASDGDGVVCYCCGVRRYNWTAEDNPRKIHERVNPNCKFLKKNGEVNVPVAYFGPFSESLVSIMGIEEPEERPEVNEDVNSDWAPERIRSPAPRPQNSQMEARTNSLGINTSIPKHTQYATKTSREVSFSGWPDTASHSPQELAEAGFFYAGFGDCVRCFFCGIGLRHWTKDDNPWIEHARWARNCVFVKQKKGEEFVNLVQLAVQYSQNNEEQTSESATGNQTPSEIERLLLSDAAQSVLEMGYQPSIIKKAIEQIRRQNSNAKLTAANLMEKVLDIEEAEKEATPVAATPAATASEKTLEGAQPTGRSTKENKDKEKQTDTKKETDKKKEKDHNRGKEAAMLKAKMKANETKQQDPKVIKEENEQLKEQTLCKVCLDNTVCIVFLPCGHLVTCADCAPAMRKCPICRALVKGTVRTYMS